MKKLFYSFIIFIFLFFSPINVFATNTNVSNKIKYSTSSAKGTYEGDEIYLGGYNGQFSVGTRYNGRLAMLSFYLSTDDYNFTTNHNYTITLNMATEDWRNHFMGPQVFESQSNGTLGSSLSASNFRFVSYKQIKFNFKTDGSLTPYIFFRVYSTDYGNPNGGNTAITGDNNWKLSSVYINDNVSATPTPAPVTPAPTATPQASNKDIIDNANKNTEDIINSSNKNTEDIINNNSQNTSDIIENNNSNTQNIIDNVNNGANQIKDSIDSSLNNMCPNVFDLSNFQTCVFTNNGNELQGCNSFIRDKNNDAGFLQFSTTGNWSGVHSDYLPVEHDGIYYLRGYNNNNRDSTSDYYCFLTNIYTKEKNFLSQDQFCTSAYQFNRQISLPYNAAYVRVAISYSDPTVFTTFAQLSFSKLNSFCPFGSSTSKLDDTTNAINNVNDSINNSNIDSGVGSDFFDDFEDNSHGLTSIITAPLTAIERLTSSTCQPLVVPIPFTSGSVSLPCMTQVYTEHIPTIYNIWKVVSFGIIAYFICIDIFHIVKGFKDPESDKVEVLDL